MKKSYYSACRSAFGGKGCFILNRCFIERLRRSIKQRFKIFFLCGAAAITVMNSYKINFFSLAALGRRN
jgi:hypothetical protein